MGILIIPFTAIMYVDVEEFYTLKEEAIMYSEITKQAENIANEIIEKAKKIDYSNISYQMIVDHIEDFYTRDIRKVVDKEWIPQKK